MKEKRWFYPYCGYTKGFCTAEKGCVRGVRTRARGCKFFSERHPLTDEKAHILAKGTL